MQTKALTLAEKQTMALIGLAEQRYLEEKFGYGLDYLGLYFKRYPELAYNSLFWRYWDNQWQITENSYLAEVEYRIAHIGFIGAVSTREFDKVLCISVQGGDELGWLCLWHDNHKADRQQFYPQEDLLRIWLKQSLKPLQSSFHS